MNNNKKCTTVYFPEDFQKQAFNTFTSLPTLNQPTLIIFPLKINHTESVLKTLKNISKYKKKNICSLKHMERWGNNPQQDTKLHHKLHN